MNPKRVNLLTFCRPPKVESKLFKNYSQNLIGESLVQKMSGERSLTLNISNPLEQLYNNCGNNGLLIITKCTTCHTKPQMMLEKDKDILNNWIN